MTANREREKSARFMFLAHMAGLTAIALFSGQLVFILAAYGAVAFLLCTSPFNRLVQRPKVVCHLVAMQALFVAASLLPRTGPLLALVVVVIVPLALYQGLWRVRPDIKDLL